MYIKPSCIALHKIPNAFHEDNIFYLPRLQKLEVQSLQLQVIHVHSLLHYNIKHWRLDHMKKQNPSTNYLEN